MGAVTQADYEFWKSLPAEVDAAAMLVGSVNATPVCGKPPGTVLLIGARWNGYGFGADISASNQGPRFDLAKGLVIFGKRTLTHRVLSGGPWEPIGGLSGDPSEALVAFGQFKAEGWNKVEYGGAWLSVVDEDGEPMYAVREFPLTLDVRVANNWSAERKEGVSDG